MNLNKNKIILLLLIPILCFGRKQPTKDFGFLNFGYVQSQAEHWGQGFGGHAEVGNGRYGLRVYFTRCRLEPEIKDFIYDSGVDDFKNYSTMFGIMLIRKIRFIRINNFIFTDLNFGLGPSFYEKKVEIDADYEYLLQKYGIGITDNGITGASGLVGLDFSVGPLILSSSLYIFKGIYMGEELEQRYSLTFGFVL